MLLSELAEALTQHLNDGKTEWSDETITVKTELDPDACLLPVLAVFVVPVQTLYNVESGRSRGSKPSTVNQQVIGLIVSKAFQELRATTDHGVAPWSEAKKIVDTRERAERYALKFQSNDLTIVAVETNPIEEIQLDFRNFVALTTFSFEQVSCDSQYELGSSSTGSNVATASARTGDSIRSRLSSAARRGSQ